MRARYPIAFAAAAVLAAAAPARAHVQVTPTEAAPGDPVVFEVLVPGETDAHTTEVSLQIPKDVLPFSFAEVPGWKRTVEQGDDGSVSVVRWRGRMATASRSRAGFMVSWHGRSGAATGSAMTRCSFPMATTSPSVRWTLLTSTGSAIAPTRSGSLWSGVSPDGIC